MSSCSYIYTLISRIAKEYVIRIFFHIHIYIHRQCKFVCACVQNLYAHLSVRACAISNFIRAFLRSDDSRKLKVHAYAIMLNKFKARSERRVAFATNAQKPFTTIHVILAAVAPSVSRVQIAST